MEYLADTVTIIRHFSGAGHIGRQAKSILEGVEKGEHRMFLSTISLVEILYLSEKKRITINLGESLEMMDESTNYSIVDLTPDIVKLAENIDFLTYLTVSSYLQRNTLARPFLRVTGQSATGILLKPSGVDKWSMNHGKEEKGGQGHTC
jgi:PIN domain nuclease of toxin-antitoxin system